MTDFLKRWVYLSLFLSTVFMPSENTNGQVHYHFFYGKILTSDSHEPISNTNITFQGSRLGTISDKRGAFSFYIDTMPIIMIISHVGYKTKKILLDGTTASMTLYMEKEIRELKEIEIKANSIEAIFKCDYYTLRDYEIDSGLLYLLIYRNRVSKQELICRNLVGDTLARSGILFFTPISLFKDCLGNLHVIGSDSVYQVFRIDKYLLLRHPVSLIEFNEILLNCVASTKKFLYFKTMISLGQGAVYYAIKRGTKEKKILSQVTDDYKLKMLRRNPGDIGFLSQRLPSFDNSISASEPSASMALDREAFDRWNWIHKVVYRPMKSSLYIVNDFICLFNIPGKEIEFYDLDGIYSLKVRLNINAVKDGEWSEDIYLDENQSKVYTTFKKGTGPTLYRIDLNTGDLHKILTIKHPFPQKIRIYEGKIYYLNDVLGSPQDKTLYRQDL
jgi:hypothetical protein